MTDTTFVVMADTQFGMFAASSGKTPEEIKAAGERGVRLRPSPKIDGFAPETALFERAVRRVNELRPAFAVVCGDMVHDPESDAQRGELFRIAAGLDRSIPLHYAPGNHDCGVDTVVPTPASLASYRKHFGRDYYAFEIEKPGAPPDLFLVLNTSTLSFPDKVPDEQKAQLAFLESTLDATRVDATRVDATRGRTYGHIVAFGHYPLFLQDPDEEHAYWTVPNPVRSRVFEMFSEHGVIAMFSGHLHANNYARAGEFEMVSTGPVGYPLGDDPSGYRVVTLTAGGMKHQYFSLEEGDLEVGDSEGER